MKIGLVITAKNEREILRQNILYHRYLGVEDVFIFLDDNADDTPATLADLPDVHIQETILPDSLRDVPEYALFIEKWDSVFVARQSINTILAMETARRRGCDWLLALDADELVCPDIARIYPGQLKEFLNVQPADAQAVLFSTHEVVQHRMDYTHVFGEETLFKKPGNAIRKKIYDPVDGSYFTIEGFYGQKMGKSALRLSANAIPRHSHKFEARDGRPLKTAKAGNVLHYYCFDYDYFVSKYRGMAGHGDQYLRGSTIERQKRLWRDLVNDPRFSDEDLRAYFKRWVLFGDREIARYRRQRRWWRRVEPAIVEIMTVRLVFENLRQNGQNTGNENQCR